MSYGQAVSAWAETGNDHPRCSIRQLANWEASRLVSTKAAVPRLLKPPSEAENTFFFASFQCLCERFAVVPVCRRQTWPKVPGFDLPVELTTPQAQPLCPPPNSCSLNVSVVLRWLCCVCACPSPSTALLTPHFPCFQQPSLCLPIIYTSVPPVW